MVGGGFFLAKLQTQQGACAHTVHILVATPVHALLNSDFMTAASSKLCTVKPLNSGHIGGRTLVHCREVVPISEVD